MKLMPYTSLEGFFGMFGSAEYKEMYKLRNELANKAELNQWGTIDIVRECGAFICDDLYNAITSESGDQLSPYDFQHELYHSGGAIYKKYTAICDKVINRHLTALAKEWPKFKQSVEHYKAIYRDIENIVKTDSSKISKAGLTNEFNKLLSDVKHKVDVFDKVLSVGPEKFGIIIFNIDSIKTGKPHPQFSEFVSDTGFMDEYMYFKMIMDNYS